MQGIFPRFYIGDVHGCAAELRRLLTFIEDFCSKADIKPQVTFLGDLCDRGPHTMQVIELAHRTQLAWPGSIALCGNHDDWFLQNISTRSNHPEADGWLNQGGIETLASYDTDLRRSVVYPVIEMRYPHHIELLRKARNISIDGPIVACHAGIRPGVPLDEQSHFDLTWIREEFTEHVDPDMGPVIHGHSPVGDKPQVTENRISIDTGCFATGKLTACFIDDRAPAMRFFQATNTDVAEVQPVLVDRNFGTVFDRLPALFANSTVKAA